MESEHNELCYHRNARYVLTISLTQNPGKNSAHSQLALSGLQPKCRSTEICKAQQKSIHCVLKGYSVLFFLLIYLCKNLF